MRLLSLVGLLSAPLAALAVVGPGVVYGSTNVHDPTIVGPESTSNKIQN